MAQCQELDGAGNPVPESLRQFPQPLFCHDIRRRTCTRGSVVGVASSARSICRNAEYSSNGRKITSLPNNRTNEMIRGCEVRSLSDQRPPPRPLYDDPVERRLVVHGF